MRRICAVALLIVLGSFLGRVSGQSTEVTVEPFVTQDLPVESLTTPEIIPTLDTVTLEPTVLSPTDLPTLIPSETSAPLPTEEATVEPIVSPSQEPVEVVTVAAPIESVVWELSVRELFEDAPQSPWLIPSSWTLDASQRLVAGPSAPLSSVRYEAALMDVQTQAAFVLSEVGVGSVAVRVTQESAYTAELDATGAVRLLRTGEVVAQTTLPLATGGSHVLNLMAVGGIVTVRVDDQVALTYTDSSPLPAGAVELGGEPDANSGLILDDLFIWLPKTETVDPTVTPVIDALPVVTAEATPESLAVIADKSEVSAQATQLLWDTPVQYTLSSSVQDVWTYTLPTGGKASYYIEIERLSGDIELDLYVMNLAGSTEHIAHAAPDGHVLIWLSHTTAGTRTLRTIPRDFVPGKSSTYRITLHSCCKPILVPDVEETFDKYVSAGHIYTFAGGGAGTSHWAYEITTPTVHYLDWFRTEGNIAFQYTIRYRSTGAIVSQGKVLVDQGDVEYPETAMYVPSSAVGWYDVELRTLKDLYPNQTKWTEGAYEIGLFYGNPYPPKPANFSILERGVTNLIFNWDEDTTDRTEYFLLLRRPFIGSTDYMLTAVVNGDTLVAGEEDLLCDTAYEYRLEAFNWASPSVYDGDNDPTDVTQEDLYSQPLTVSTLGCPPPNDVRSGITIEPITTLPVSFEYGPNTDLYINSARDNTDDPTLSCAPDGYSTSLWYRYNTAAVPVILNIATANSTYDTVIGVYQNVNGQLIEKACHDDLEAFVNTTSQVIYETAPNQQYFILVAHWGPGLPDETAVGHVQFSQLQRPAAPVLLSPLNKGATKEDLTWSDVPNAAEYHLQISAAATFTNRLTDEYLPAVAAGKIADTIPDGVYFWRVRAVTADGITGPWSAIWSFTKDTIAPPVPTIAAPLANTVFTTLRPSFSASVPLTARAVRYEWEVATNEDFTSLVPITPTSSPVALFKLTQSLAQGQYFAHVRACDAAGNCGPYTDARPFGVDLRLLPANNAPVIAASAASAVVFRWTLPQGITEFKLEVSADKTFQAVPDYRKTFTVPAPPAAAPLAWSIANVGTELGLGQFYWRLVLTSPNLPDVTTLPRRFIVTPPVPAAPKWVAQPNAGILNTSALKLEWTTIAYAYLGASYDVTYEVQVDNQATFVSPEYRSTTPISGPTHTTTPLSDGIYYARVRTVNEFGAPGLWSLPQKVTIDTGLPAAPVITAPYLNAMSTNARQPVTWKPVPGATLYRVQYSRTAAFDDLWVNEEIKAPVPPALPAFVPKISLAQGQYFVRVAARDAALNWGPTSETVFTFTVNTSPADNGNQMPTLATPTTARPLFKWAAVPGATQYQVVVATDSACTTVIAKSPVLLPTVLAWSYTIDVNGTQLAPLGYGTYYWCVAINRGAGTAAFAPRFSNALEMPLAGFRLNIAPSVPPAVTIVYPVTALPVPASQPSIVWNEIPDTIPNGPFKYEVQIDDNPLFNDREFELITGLDDISILTDMLADGKYNLRIRAINSGGGVGAWSLVRPFTIDTKDPETPTLLTPTQDGTVTTLLPTFTWTPVPDAVAYLVQVSHSPNFSPRYQWEVKTTSAVMPFALLNQTYYVRVRAIDWADNRSIFTPYHAFNVQWPAKQPPIPVYYSTSTPTLLWERVTWATRYEVQVSANPTFTQVVASAVKSTMLYPEDALFDVPPRVDGIYYWRVRAGTETQWFAWSDVITFAVDS